MNDYYMIITMDRSQLQQIIHDYCSAQGYSYVLADGIGCMLNNPRTATTLIEIGHEYGNRHKIQDYRYEHKDDSHYCDDCYSEDTEFGYNSGIKEDVCELFRGIDMTERHKKNLEEAKLLSDRRIKMWNIHRKIK